jgi:hypothetical protein
MADTRERRTDLEAIPYKRPQMLTPTLFPMLPRAQRQGVIYYQDYAADPSAQTGRTAGTAPTTTLVADAQTTFNLENDEFIKRMEIPDGDIAGLGGLDKAQMVAARRGMRAVGNSVEALTAANILANASVTYVDILASLIDAVGVGYETLADRAEGRVALVCSHRIFNRIKQYDEVVERMKFTGVLPASVNDVRGISAAQLSAALGVDDVLVGPTALWYTASAAYQDRAALVVIPDGDMEPTEDLQVGRTLWFMPDGGTPAVDPALFEIHSFFSDTELSEMVDVRAYAEQHVFNAELIYGLDGIDAENTVTTTTTTTT